MDGTGPILVHVRAHVREEHEWVSRAGGLFRFMILEVVVNGHHDGGRLALLVTDLDEGEEP